MTEKNVAESVIYIEYFFVDFDDYFGCDKWDVVALNKFLKLGR